MVSATPFFGPPWVLKLITNNLLLNYRLQSGPLSCLTITPDQLIAGGSTFGSVAIADLASGERLALLRSSFSPTGLFSNWQRSLLFYYIAMILIFKSNI